MDYTFSIVNKRTHSKKLKGLFCSTCETEFDSVAAHQQHYKSDFHKYNLRRRMVDLMPVSEETYEQRKKGNLQAFFSGDLYGKNGC